MTTISMRDDVSHSQTADRVNDTIVRAFRQRQQEVYGRTNIPALWTSRNTGAASTGGASLGSDTSSQATQLPMGSATAGPPAPTQTPRRAPAAQAAATTSLVRARVLLMGFKCLWPTWDHAGRADGAEDEIFMTGVFSWTNPDGSTRYGPAEVRSPVYGQRHDFLIPGYPIVIDKWPTRIELGTGTGTGSTATGNWGALPRQILRPGPHRPGICIRRGIGPCRGRTRRFRSLSGNGSAPPISSPEIFFSCHRCGNGIMGRCSIHRGGMLGSKHYPMSRPLSARRAAL